MKTMRTVVLVLLLIVLAHLALGRTEARGLGIGYSVRGNVVPIYGAVQADSYRGFAMGGEVTVGATSSDGFRLVSGADPTGSPTPLYRVFLPAVLRW